MGLSHVPSFSSLFHIFSPIVSLSRRPCLEAFSLAGLASIYLYQGELAEAKSCFFDAIGLYKQTCGLEHPDVDQCLTGITRIAGLEGTYSEAEILLREALKARKQILGPDHPGTISVVVELAALKALEAPLRRALARYEEILGPNHPKLARVLNELAAIYRDQKKYSEAERHLLRAKAIYEQALQPGHPDAIIVLAHLASVYRDQKRYVESDALFIQALALSESVMGMKKLEHYKMRDLLIQVTEIYRRRKEYTKAEQLFQRAGEIDDRISRSLPFAADPRVWLRYARVLTKQGRRKEASRQARRFDQKLLAQGYSETITRRTRGCFIFISVILFMLLVWTFFSAFQLLGPQLFPGAHIGQLVWGIIGAVISFLVFLPRVMDFHQASGRLAERVAEMEGRN